MRQSPSSEQQRFAIATAIFIACCLLSSVRVLTETPALSFRPIDDIAQRSDQRFAAVKMMLPNRGIVGYIGDSSSPSDYYLAQYALAPLVVDNSINHSWVVGNFTASPPVAPSNDLQLVKDFGNGVMLFAHHPAHASAARGNPSHVNSGLANSAQSNKDVK